MHSASSRRSPSSCEEFHGTPETAYDKADTPITGDTRVQNLNFRDDTVLDSAQLDGTAGDDDIEAGPGNDTINALAGDDRVIAGNGKDKVIGRRRRRPG